MAAPTRRALFGTDEPAHPTRVLRAGPLTVRLSGTRVTGVAASGHEAWHGIAFLYRDTDWGTPEPVIDALEVREQDGGFGVRIQAHVPTEPPIDLAITIDGDAQGRLRYEGTATPRGDIDTHRCGLCLLHPATLAGQPLEVLHDDGRTSRSRFPQQIAPWPPFLQVRGLRHEFAPGRWAQADFEGDVFELEDQRNNADASFKTYNRSNLMPRPYRLRAATPVRQGVALRLLPQAPSPVPDAWGPHPQEAPPQALPRPFPLLGLAMDPPNAADGARARAALRRLRPPQMHLSLDAPDLAVDWPEVANRLAISGASLRLDIAGLVETQAERALASLAQALRRHAIAPECIAVFPGCAPVTLAARRAFANVPVGTGTRHFFTQLNRIEDLGPVDFLCFTTSALVHGADDESILLGLRSLPAMHATLAARHPGVEVRIGPSGIAARRSPLGRLRAGDGRTRQALVDADPRSHGLFGAAWLLGHVAQCAAAGARAVSLLALDGPGGLLSRPGPLPPAFFVLEALGPARILRGAGLACQGRLAFVEFEDGAGEVHRLQAHLALEPAGANAQPAEAAPDGARVQHLDVDSWMDFAAGRADSPWRAEHGCGAQVLGPCALTWTRWSTAHARPES